MPAAATTATTTASVGSAARLWRLVQMIVAVTGIYICFGLWSVLQERMMKRPYFPHDPANAGAVGEKGEMFPSVFGIGCAQALMGWVVAVVIIALQTLGKALVGRRNSTGSHQQQPPAQKQNGNKNKQGGERGGEDAPPPFSAADLRELLLMGFTNAFGTTLGYSAMRLLSYPVVLTTKMSKMIPVMTVGFLWHGTRYPRRKVTACLLITGGILSFYFLEEAGPARADGRPSKAAEANAGGLGFLLLFLNLVMDGFTNSTQDALVRRRGWSGMTLMAWTNFVSASWVLLVMLMLEVGEPVVHAIYASLARTPSAAGLLQVLPPASYWTPTVFPFRDLSRTLRFVQRYPEAGRDLVSMSALNGVGQLFIFRTISLFGSLTLTTMTLLRKAGSIVLSIYVHGHHVSALQWASLATVMVGIGLDAWTSICSVPGDKQGKHRPQLQRKGDPAITSAAAATINTEKKPAELSPAHTPSSKAEKKQTKKSSKRHSAGANKKQ